MHKLCPRDVQDAFARFQTEAHEPDARLERDGASWRIARKGTTVLIAHGSRAMYELIEAYLDGYDQGWVDSAEEHY